jgi:hypothetical protein
LADHPGRGAANEMTDRTRKGQAGASMDLSLVPLRPDAWSRSATTTWKESGFHDSAQFGHWRLDRDPASCDYDHLERPA